MSEKSETKSADQLPRLLSRTVLKGWSKQEALEELSKFMSKILPPRKQKQRLDLYERNIKALGLPYMRTEDKIVIQIAQQNSSSTQATK